MSVSVAWGLVSRTQGGTLTSSTGRGCSSRGQSVPSMMRRLSSQLYPGPGASESWLPVGWGSGGLVRKLVLRAVWRLLLRSSRLPKEDLFLKKSPMSRPVLLEDYGYRPSEFSHLGSGSLGPSNFLLDVGRRSPDGRKGFPRKRGELGLLSGRIPQPACLPITPTPCSLCPFLMKQSCLAQGL